MRSNRHLLIQSQQWKHGNCYKISSKLTLKTPERRRLSQSLFFNKVTGLRPVVLLKKKLRQKGRHSGVFIVDFEKVSKIVPVFPVLALNK